MVLGDDRDLFTALPVPEQRRRAQFVRIASVLTGMARAWELVGNWDTGVLSSIALLMGRQADVPVPDVPERPAGSERLP